MRGLTLFTALVALVPAVVLAAPQGATETPIKSFSGPKAGGYIVKLKNTARKSSASSVEIPAGAVELDLINGFSGQFDEATAKALASHPDVEYVEEDGLASVAATITQ